MISSDHEPASQPRQPRRHPALVDIPPSDYPEVQVSGEPCRLTDRELFERLGWFISIRWVAGLAALLLVLIGWYRFKVRIPPRPVIHTIWVLFMYNALFLLLVTDAYRRQRVSRRFIVGCANAQMICDLFTLAVLMHFTGGVENPFIVFFICPMIIACELLSARNAYGYAALGSVLIHAVAWLEYAGILPHVPVGEALGVQTYHCPLTVAKFTIAFSCLLFAAVFLGSTIASRLRKREHELEDAYDRLRALEESKSFLMRRISHDLRAPLNAVVAMFQAIAAEAVDECSPALREFINRAVQRTLSLSTLIEELHRYATLRDATTAIHTELFDFAGTVRQTINTFTPIAKEKQITITSDIQPALVYADPIAMAEVADNLLTNAIQYTPASGQIHVRLARSAKTVRLEVQDTGIGIPSEAIEKIFEEFYRTSNAKQMFRNGTGMGLPIVKRIIQAHSGTIEVHSQLGKGSTFTVTLTI